VNEDQKYSLPSAAKLPASAHKISFLLVITFLKNLIDLIGKIRYILLFIFLAVFN
jgi:hypothetical protein